MQVTEKTHSSFRSIELIFKSLSLLPDSRRIGRCASSSGASTSRSSRREDAKNAKGQDLDRLAEYTMQKAGIAPGQSCSQGGIAANEYQRLREQITAVAPAAARLLVSRCWIPQLSSTCPDDSCTCLIV
jgi:hypothetical protein